MYRPHIPVEKNDYLIRVHLLKGNIGQIKFDDILCGIGVILLVFSIYIYFY